MPRRVAQNCSLTPEHAAFIADQVALNRYGKASEVVRAVVCIPEDGACRPGARPAATGDSRRT